MGAGPKTREMCLEKKKIYINIISEAKKQPSFFVFFNQTTSAFVAWQIEVQANKALFEIATQGLTSIPAKQGAPSIRGFSESTKGFEKGTLTLRPRYHLLNIVPSAKT